MIRYIIISLITGTSIFIYAGCSEKDSGISVLKSVNVAVRPAVTNSLLPFIETVGTLYPNDEVTISTEVDGKVESISVDEGTIVSKGMQIASISDTDYMLEVMRARASMKQAQASLINLRLEYQRKKSLYDEGVLSQQDYDFITSQLSLAESAAENAGAALSIAERMLTKTRIYSPIDGVVTNRMVSGGNFIRNGTSICTIIQVDPLKLSFTVSEKDAGKLKKGQDLKFRIDTFREREFPARLNIIYPGLDERTRTLMAEAIVSNEDGSLKPGYFATIKLFTGRAKQAVLVPATALLYEGETIRVFTVHNETAEEHIVEIGAKYGEMMEITEGLKAGDIVVIAGQQNLSHGARVNVAR